MFFERIIGLFSLEWLDISFWIACSIIPWCFYNMQIVAKASYCQQNPCPAWVGCARSWGGSTAAPSPPCAYIELQWWKWEENSDFKAFFEKKIQFSQHPPWPIELIFCTEKIINKTGYTATQVACGWAGEVLEKVTRASGQEPHAQKAPKRQKSNRSPKGNMWSAIPIALLCMVVNWNERQGSGPKGDKVL